MTQVNLLPPEILQQAVIRRNTFLVGAVGVLLISDRSVDWPTSIISTNCGTPRTASCYSPRSRSPWC